MNLCWNFGDWCDAFTRRLQIHAGATDDDRQTVGLARDLNRRSSKIQPACYRGTLAAIDNAIKTVRRPRLIVCAGSCRYHTKIAVDLHGVCIDHRAAGLLGKSQRHRRLAGRRRPANHQIAPRPYSLRDFTVVSHLVLCFTGRKTILPEDAALRKALGKRQPRTGREPLHQTAVFSSSARGSVSADIAGGILDAAGIDADLAAVRVLDETFALDLPMPAAVDVDGMAMLRASGDRQGIDVNIVSSEHRKKQLLIADMDSTIITSESLDDMAQLAGIADDILPITTRAMRGELDFEQALDARLALFAGKPASLVDEALAEVEFSGGATTLVRTMRAAGASCYLVSGGFTAITQPVAAQCGFNDTHANHLEIEDGKLLGKVRKPVLDSGAKARYLAHYCAELSITPAEAACIGDGANDLDMLEAAGFGVAFYGKPMLREKIPLQLNHTDLTGLLYLQGYTADAFITG